MATLTATQIGTTAHVRLELDWSSNIEVEYVKIVRLRPGETYNTTTNTGGTPIRLPTWGNTFSDEFGTWTYLSNSRAIFYDTEAPLDTALTWVAVGRSFPPLVRDAYGRVLANDWGSPDLGAAYTETGTIGDFDVASGKGTIQPTATATDRFATVAVAGNFRRARLDLSWGAMPATGELRGGPAVIWADANNYYVAELVVFPTTTVRLRLVRRQAGVRVELATVNLTTTAGYGYTYAANAVWRIVGQKTSDGFFRMKAWPLLGVPEPADWQIEFADSALGGAEAGAFARNETAVTTHVASFDNLLVDEIDQVSTTTTSGSVTVASASLLWLKDPLRPGLDQALDLCPTAASGCVGPSGMFFHSMSGINRAADHMIGQVANRVRPTAVSRLRKSMTGELQIVTRTLVARDALVALVANGTPLLLQAPAVYGIPDLYMQVGDVQEDRISTDQRTPHRLFSLPWVEVDGPAGPAEGVPETRWNDLCTNYAAWSNLIAAGWTWTDIMQGDAA